MAPLQRHPSHAGSKTSSRLTAALAWKPRLYMLISGFVAICAVTIGVLGWQLTLNAGHANVASLMEEIELLVSTMIMTYFDGMAQTLSALTLIQSQMFQSNFWSFLTPSASAAAFAQMLILLDGAQKYTTSFYIQTYPDGNQMGYNYFTDANGTSLRWWQQENDTVSTYACDPTGTILWNGLISNRTSVGNGLLETPGNNNTIKNAAGGISGANLQYAKGPTTGTTPPFLQDNQLVKSSLAYSINSVTGEKVVFGNDWSLEFVSNQIINIISVVQFPVFAAAIKVSTGTVMATSSQSPLFDAQAQHIFTINQIQDPFFQDFSVLVNSTFTFGLIDDLPAQLENICHYLRYYYGGANWKLGLNAFNMLGKEILIVVYMNIDSVQVQLGKQSTATGYVITGIIVTFVIVGGLFSILIDRQLAVVSNQIRLLRDLKFKEVLGGDSEVKDRSFISELAELQKCFYPMVVKFSEFIKVSPSLRDPTNMSAGVAAPNVLRGVTASQHHTGAVNLTRKLSGASAPDQTFELSYSDFGLEALSGVSAVTSLAKSGAFSDTFGPSNNSQVTSSAAATAFDNANAPE
ncbi:hypothetical protein HDU98_008143 [Podochytrium sp. JEL0797]|nr:hypothetical protein HDU98_008143 [Podochytrium sp. JEL0797]